MERVLEEISLLSKQSRLVPAEEIIMKSLINFETLIPEKLTEPEIENIENLVISLLFINQGNLSYHCSMRIGKILTLIYLKSSHPKIWGIISAASEKPCSSCVIACGYVIKILGKRSKSTISSFVKILLKVCPKLPYQCLFALRYCFKTHSIDIKGFSDSAYTFCQKSMSGLFEVNQLMSLKLIYALAQGSYVDQKHVKSFVTKFISKCSSSFVVDEMCLLIAKLMILYSSGPKNLEKQGAEFSLSKVETSNSSFKDNLVFFATFKDNFSQIIRRFLDIADPEFIHNNLSTLFECIRKTQPTDITQLLSIFGSDIRLPIFQTIAKESLSLEQFNMLKYLSCDKNMESEVAAAALQLSMNDAEEARTSIGSFFSSLPSSYPDIAIQYLESSLLFLSFPPADSPTLDKEIYGMGLIASSILSGYGEEKKLILEEQFKSQIIMFLNRSLTSAMVYSYDLMTAFQFMSLLSPPLIPNSLVNQRLADVLNLLEKKNNSLDIRDLKLKALCRSVFSFISVHPSTSLLPSLFQNVFSLGFLLNPNVFLSLIRVASKKILDSSTSYFYLRQITSRLLNNNPPLEYLKQMVLNPMLEKHELLFHIIPVLQRYDAVYERIGSISYSVFAIKEIPKAIVKLDPNDGMRLIKEILAFQTNFVVTHALLLELIRLPNSIPLFTNGFHLQILPIIFDEKSDIIQLQISSECISEYIKYQPHIMADVLSILSTKKNKGKCLLLSSLLSHLSFSDNQLLQIIHELDTLLKSNNLIVFSLFTLNILFSRFFDQLIGIPMVFSQFQILFSTMHSDFLHDPYTMYFISSCLSYLIPMINPLIFEEDLFLRQQITLNIQTLFLYHYPYGYQVMFYCLKSVLIYIREVFDTSIVKYPSNGGMSYPLMSLLCSVFSDFLRLEKDPPDLFGSLPKALYLLQRRYDLKIEEYILTLVHTDPLLNGDQESDKLTRIVDWVKIIKNVLTRGTHPIFTTSQVEPSQYVKKTCLLCTVAILDFVSKISPFPGECVDDIVTSAVRAVESDNIYYISSAFSVLDKIVLCFSKMFTTTNMPILKLYDSQFSLVSRLAILNHSNSCGDYLFNYLEFRITNFSKDSSEDKAFFDMILSKIYFSDFSTPSILNAMSLLITSMKKIDYLFENGQSLIDKYIVSGSKVISEIMEMFFELNIEWNKLAHYRSLYINSLYLIFSCCIIYDKKSLMDLPTISRFALDQIQKNNELWIQKAAYFSLISLFESSSTIMDNSLISTMINSIIDNSSRFSYDLVQISKSTAKVLSKTSLDLSTWQRLAKFIIEKGYSSTALAYLIKYSTEENIKLVIKELFDVSFLNLDKYISSILLSRVNENIEWCFEYFLLYEFPRKDSSIRNFKLSLIRLFIEKGISYCSDSIFNHLSKYLWTVFRKGGMEIISFLVRVHPDIGNKVFFYKEMTILSELCEKDITNCAVYIDFSRFCIIRLNCIQMTNNIKCLSLIALKSLISFGSDPQKGNDIIRSSVQLFAQIREMVPQSLEESYKCLTNREIQMVNSILEKEITKTQTRKKVKNLKVFSSGQRRAQQDEWQDL